MVRDNIYTHFHGCEGDVSACCTAYGPTFQRGVLHFPFSFIAVQLNAKTQSYFTYLFHVHQTDGLAFNNSRFIRYTCTYIRYIYVARSLIHLGRSTRIRPLTVCVHVFNIIFNIVQRTRTLCFTTIKFSPTPEENRSEVWFFSIGNPILLM